MGEHIADQVQAGLHVGLDDQPATVLTGLSPRQWSWASSAILSALGFGENGVAVLHVIPACIKRESTGTGIDSRYKHAGMTLSIFTNLICAQYMQGNPVAIEISEPGLHTLHIWQREDGLRLDQIVLTTDDSYIPVGIEPIESERNSID